MVTVTTTVADLMVSGPIPAGGVGMMYEADGPLVGRIVLASTPGVVYRVVDNPNGRLLAGFMASFPSAVAVSISP